VPKQLRHPNLASMLLTAGRDDPCQPRLVNAAYALRPTKEKLANFTHVPAENCLGVHDVSNIYRVPLLLQHQGAAQNLLARLALISRPNAKLLSEWTSLAELVRGSADSHHLVDSLTTIVTIAVVGKYTDLSDAYLSISKALNHASYHVERKLNIEWVNAEDLDDDVAFTDASK
ncbi:MAG: hypothetical protein SGPRY_005491, partial [Prymnesium sp.]